MPCGGERHGNTEAGTQSQICSKFENMEEIGMPLQSTDALPARIATATNAIFRPMA